MERIYKLNKSIKCSQCFSDFVLKKFGEIDCSYFLFSSIEKDKKNYDSILILAKNEPKNIENFWEEISVLVKEIEGWQGGE